MKKKQAFADIHSLIEADRIADAIGVCDQAIRGGGKDANNPKLLVVNKLAQDVARKYGVAT